MPGPDPHDDTSRDYEQFEKELLAQDRDAIGDDTADVDDRTAQNLINDLIDADIVTPASKNEAVINEPSTTTSNVP
nr:hypothetical protein [Halobacterium hubeiense]